MNTLLIDALEVVKPLLSPKLFTESAVRGLWDVAREMAPIYRLGFECRLDADQTAIDLSQGILKEEGEDKLLNTFLDQLTTSNNPSLASSWLRLSGFCKEWTTQNGPLNDHVSELWLEYDISERTKSLNIPSVFFGFSEPGPQSSSRLDITQYVFELLTGRLISSELNTTLERCFRELVGSAKPSHIGVMISREIDAIRVSIKGITAEEIPSYLERIEHRSSWIQYESLVQALSQCTDEIRLDLDVGSDVFPHFGIEYFMCDPSNRGIAWTPLLDELVTHDLCSPEKRDALLSWPGFTGPPMALTDWPELLLIKSLTKPDNQLGILARTINHVKVTFHPERPPQAKAYLGFGHTWITPRP